MVAAGLVDYFEGKGSGKVRLVIKSCDLSAGGPATKGKRAVPERVDRPSA